MNIRSILILAAGLALAGSIAAAVPGVVGAAFTVFPIQENGGSGPFMDVCWNSSDDEHLVVQTVWAAGEGTLHGRVVDAAAGIPIAPSFAITTPTGNGADQPALAYAPASGGRYMVLFTQADPSGPPSPFSPTIFARFLDAAGTDIGTGTVMVDEPAQTSEWQGNPSVTFDGTRFLAVWARGSAQGDIMGRFFATDGSPIGAVFSVSAGPEDEERATVSLLGAPSNVSLVAYAADIDADSMLWRYEIRCRTVTFGAPPAVGASQTLASPTVDRSADWPDLAANGQEWMAVWQETDSTFYRNWGGRNQDGGGTALTIGRIRCIRVGAAGNSVGAAVPLGAALDFMPGIAWCGATGSYAVQWQRGVIGAGGSAIIGAIVGGNGQVFETDTIIVDAGLDEAHPRLAGRAGGAEAFAVWGVLKNAPWPPETEIKGSSYGWTGPAPAAPSPPPPLAEKEKDACGAAAGTGAAPCALLPAVFILGLRCRRAW